MTRLLKLTEAGSDPAAPSIDPVVAQLHQRLTRNDYADSSEVRIALLAEMVFRIYINTTNVYQR